MNHWGSHNSSNSDTKIVVWIISIRLSFFKQPKYLSGYQDFLLGSFLSVPTVVKNLGSVVMNFFNETHKIVCFILIFFAKWILIFLVQFFLYNKWKKRKSECAMNSMFNWTQCLGFIRRQCSKSVTFRKHTAQPSEEDELDPASRLDSNYFISVWNLDCHKFSLERNS